MAKLFSVSGFAAAANATRCSGSVATVTEDNVIVAGPVGSRRAGDSNAAPTVATSKVQKEEPTIATDSASTGNDWRK
jgi:hypothetical protein